MKFLYLTNVQMPAGDAQSLQIQAMSKAFFMAVGTNFLLISPRVASNKDLKTNYQWRRVSVSKFLPRSLRQLILMVKTTPLILKFKPDIIYTRDIALALIYKIFGFLVVYEIHKPFVTKIGNQIFKLLAPKIKIVAISNILKRFIIEKYQLEEKNILVTPDGIFIEDFEKIKLTKKELKKKYLNLPEENFVALYAGTFQQGKGIDLILKAAPSLKDVFFVIIGGGEAEIEKLKRGASNNVLFFKRKSHQEIPFFLKASDLLILPLTKELIYWRYSSPLKLFEYMGAKTPILASNIGSITEVLNEKNSFLFNPEDLNDLIDKIKFVQDNWQEREKRADTAFRDVKEYTWQKRVDKILSFLLDDYEKTV